MNWFLQLESSQRPWPKGFRQCLYYVSTLLETPINDLLPVFFCVFVVYLHIIDSWLEILNCVSRFSSASRWKNLSFFFLCYYGYTRILILISTMVIFPTSDQCIWTTYTMALRTLILASILDQMLICKFPEH